MRVLLFFVRLFYPRNWPLAFYLLLNVFIVFFVITFNWFLDSTDVASFQRGIFIVLVYLGLLLIALSPVGESILRSEYSARPFSRSAVNDDINEIFSEVYYRVRQSDASVSQNVKLYFIESEEKNAFALGSRTIIITSGLLDMPKPQIKAVLAHEFGHLVTFDSYNKVAVLLGNVLFYAIWRIISLIICTVVFIIENLFTFRLSILPRMSRGKKAMTFAVWGFLGKIYDMWVMIGVLLVLKTSRSAEYKADQFAAELGYSEALARALYLLSKGKKRIYCAADILLSSHPDIDSRVEKLGFRFI